MGLERSTAEAFVILKQLYRLIKAKKLFFLKIKKVWGFWSLTYCQSCARVGCTVRGGAAWQTGGEEGGEEGSRPGGGRAAEMEEGAGAAEVAPIALPDAKSGA